MINKKRLISLTQKLIRINSENPPADSRAITAFVTSYLRSLGLDVRAFEFKKGIINLVAVVRGAQRRSLLISPHLDTVPAGNSWRHNPFGAQIQAGKIFGLGATDCKCNVAVLLEAVNSLRENNINLSYDLILVFTSDEETGSDFSLVPLLKRKIIRADAALILDADELDMIIAQKGLIHSTFKIFGRRAHGAYPWRGENAIEIASRIICDLKEIVFPGKKHSLLLPPTVNIGKIKGGDKVNIVADYCEFEVDFRFLPGMKAEKIISQARDIARRHCKKFQFEAQNIQQPYELPKNHPLVKGWLKSAKKIGVESEIKGSEGATVITFFQHHNIPAVASGFGVRGCAHMSDEYVRINTLYKGALVLEDFLKNY